MTTFGVWKEKRKKKERKTFLRVAVYAKIFEIVLRNKAGKSRSSDRKMAFTRDRTPFSRQK